jgi:hypothetical protein
MEFYPSGKYSTKRTFSPKERDVSVVSWDLLAMMSSPTSEQNALEAVLESRNGPLCTPGEYEAPLPYLT